MLLSVIIPTYGPSQKLRSLLRDIAGTRSDHDAFEIVVVVDGHGSEPLEHGAVLPESIRFRGLNKDHAGPAAARNYGIEHASGRWLLFLDDDARVEPDTIPGHLRRIRRDPEARHAYLGRVDWPPQRLDSPWSLLLSETSMLFFWDRMHDGRRYGFRHFWTSNLSVRRDVVQAVGGFREGFPTAMHEDIELGWRLRQRFDLEVEVVASIRSLHDHPLTPSEYLQREHKSGRSARAARDINREFHDEVWSWVTDAEGQLYALQSMLLPTARRTAAIMTEWARPGERRPSRDELDALYLAHLPLKRMAFLSGYVDRDFDVFKSELGVGDWGLAGELDAGGFGAGALGVVESEPGERAMSVALETLKGGSFAESLREIWAEPVDVAPLADLRRRRILVPGLIGGEIQFGMLALLAEALRLRGADVTALVCDSTLPACSLRKADHAEKACDRWCHANLPSFLAATPLPHRWYGQLVPEPQRQRLREVAARVDPREVPSLNWRGAALGEHILRSIEGHFKVGRFDPRDPVMAAAAPRFVAAALIMHAAAERALQELEPDKLLLNDGQKIKWGIIRSMARERGIPVDVIRGGPRAGTVSFERDVPGLPPARMRGWSVWREVPLDAEQDASLEEYMTRRATRPYENRPLCEWTRRSDASDVRASCGISAADRGIVFAMFPNLSYDSGTTSSRPVFATPAEWVARTIEFFRDRPEHRLVVKTNPTEVIRTARDPLLPTLQRRLGVLPPNVHVLPADTSIAAQDLIPVTDVVLAFTSTVIVEAAYLGRPVMLVGGGRHKGTGIAIDVDDADDYFRRLESMCAGALPDPVPRVIARRYAYAMFFRDLVPLHLTTVRGRDVVRLGPRSRRDLLRGVDPALDMVCRGILCDAEIAWGNGRSDDAKERPREDT